MNTIRQKAVKLPRLFGRGFSDQRSPECTSRFLRLKENQKKFGCDDGVPVFLKNGFRDKLLYQLSWIINIVGIGMEVHFFYKLTHPDNSSKEN